MVDSKKYDLPGYAVSFSFGLKHNLYVYIYIILHVCHVSCVSQYLFDNTECRTALQFLFSPLFRTIDSKYIKGSYNSGTLQRRFSRDCGQIS